MQVFFVDRRQVERVGPVPGIDLADVRELFKRRLVSDGTAIVLDSAMQPVEPVSSWLRAVARDCKPKTSRAYAYIALRLMDFLAARGLGLLTAAETDLTEYRQWRREDQDKPISGATWDKEAAAINSFYRWAVACGHLRTRPWRSAGGRRDSFRSGVERDMRVRHMTLEQYLYFRDVGLGGHTPDGEVDFSFRGWSPQRNRAGVELALLTGMRLQEWSTVLLPELGTGVRRPGEPADFGLSACAKFGRPRTVHVPAAVLSQVDTYMHLEREHIVRSAQPVLKARCQELFVVSRIQHDAGKLHGRLDGRKVVRHIADMEPWLRRITVLDTGERLEPLALFVGQGGRMLQPSSWDKIRWHAWDRMTRFAAEHETPVMPRHRWLFHNLRHTFALRLLIFLTEQELSDGKAADAPMSTLLDHMTCNPILRVQDCLGHASPATTYRYIRYLKDPMRDVADAFRGWSAQDGASYAEIALQVMAPGRRSDAAQG
ncbi:tyrosine-type recombinase/integrase [Streptomyces acidiscabies]|uniref:tyrosine-type recombinase/integrase n=1 Tax=Streptomyces acidiscabies TaxID=42234 RepID=UPI00076E9B16|nr:site-specific integrase [Streptomyces acidiscabies]GAQ54902.1 site-specific tyrosine recombinase XerC [Streptomyces acidiscabies]GAV46225.1 site-specific tyrosine recombinase XerC [Streptomyces acidiscabies]